MHWKAKTHTIQKESTPNAPVVFVCTVGCPVSLCCVTVCFSGVCLVKIHSCTQAWRAWILPAHLVSSFEHHCADPTSHLPRFGVTSVPCYPAYNMAIMQKCWAHFRTGDCSMPVHRRHVPNVLLGQLLVRGHGLRHMCPTVRRTVAVNHGSQRKWRSEREAGLHKAHPSVYASTSNLSAQVCERGSEGISESVQNQTDLVGSSFQACGLPTRS